MVVTLLYYLTCAVALMLALWSYVLDPAEAGVAFVCDACANQRHGECPGSTRCDCQHRPRGDDER